MEMGLSVVQPAIVEISSDFTQTLLGKSYYDVANNSRGINVGSKYITAYTILANDITLTPQQEAMAQNIFGFDLLIQNSDRNFEKPNMITDGNDLVILDHELGFGFLLVLPFLRNPQPWTFDESDLLWIRKHCLCKRLKGRTDELDAFSERLTNLDSNFWTKAYNLIPKEWMVEDMFFGIKKHIDLIIENKEAFINNIKIILS